MRLNIEKTTDKKNVNTVIKVPIDDFSQLSKGLIQQVSQGFMGGQFIPVHYRVDEDCLYLTSRNIVSSSRGCKEWQKSQT